jgi:hypothetical protein
MLHPAACHKNHAAKIIARIFLDVIIACVSFII